MNKFATLAIVTITCFSTKYVFTNIMLMTPFKAKKPDRFFTRGCGNVWLKLSSSHYLRVFPSITLNVKDIDAIFK